MPDNQAYKIKIEQFEGPLDLLLQLIEKDKLDITEISLGNVTEQYLENLNQIENLYPEELADFLVVATKLLLIKSRTMLPYIYPEDEEEGDLEEQLRIYKQFLEATKKIDKIIKNGRYIYAREQVKLNDIQVKFSPPENIKASHLKEMFIGVLKRLEPVVKLPKVALIKVISLKEKISHIQNEIIKKAELSFSELLHNAKDRTEIIVTFLALLELTKQKVISVEQNKLFDEISVKKNGNNN